ncbi:UNVERIFIED_CONTAM: Serine/threonine-protein kinase-like protein [Sesamum calycinum]|uniref:Serine/threonine-protein kinase-like protein n=1 Tax=Sesamum calycinum TaxID=2727403 RepID=A0AAW2R7N3_9LAMI
MKEFDLQELEVATDSFSSSRIVGKGSHGSVYGGVLKDGNHVAVKKQSLGLQKLRDNTKLENEARILSSLPPHPSLINLLGVSHDPFGNRILVTEYMPNGTLHEILHLSASPLPWSKRVEFAIQIAKGLADFGLAIRLNNKDELNLPAGTIGYLDPSYTTPSKLSTKIDVFSYGVLLLELISSRKVIDVLESPASIVEWALPLIERGRMTEVLDKRVHLPRYMGGTIKQLLWMAACCLSPTESLRPSMGEIVANLEGSIIRPVRLPLSINFIRDIILKILRRKTFKFGGTKRNVTAPITRRGTCADHDMRR